MAITTRPNNGILDSFIFPDKKFSAKVSLFPDKPRLISIELSITLIVV